MTKDEIRRRMQEIRHRLTEFRDIAEERKLTDREDLESRELMEEYDGLSKDHQALELREKRLAAMQGTLGPGSTEDGEDRSGDDDDHTRRAARRTGLPAHASAARSAALRGVEHISDRLDNQAAKRLETLIDESAQTPAAVDVRYLAAVSDPNYRSAFGKLLAGDPASAHLRMSSAELEALQRANTPEFRSLTTTQSGYAVPAAIDPTVINVSSGVLNPYRQMARVVTITGTNEWRAITSAGITASYDAEAAEVSDDTPALAQPTIIADKAQSLVTFTIESGEDWGGLQADMAAEFADAKDRLEESKFTLGAGHGSHEPQGVITGATANYTTLATSVTPALADFTAAVDALDDRWLSNASWVTHKTMVSKIVNLAITAGYSQPFADISTGGERGRDVLVPLMGDPLYRSTSIAKYTTPGAKCAVYGDFRQYVIVDRVGMSVELVPHLFNTANNLPDGRRGLYCYWRNGAGVLTTAAFVVVKSS